VETYASGKVTAVLALDCDVFCACEGGVEDWCCVLVVRLWVRVGMEWCTVCAACEEEEHGCGVDALVLRSVLVLVRFGCDRDEAVVMGGNGVAVDWEVRWIVARLRLRWVRVVYVYVARNESGGERRAGAVGVKW
jgi:hypothetical protein